MNTIYRAQVGRQADTPLVNITVTRIMIWKENRILSYIN